MLQLDRGATAAGFRTQLLQRLRNQALREGIPVLRFQQRIAFERFLVRLSTTDQWVLKGGFALQFRYGLLGRPTVDVDLRASLPIDQAVALLRRDIATTTVADHFDFVFGPAAQALMDAPDGALRIKVTARLAGSEFASFHLDISAGDVLVERPTVLRGSDYLLFAGIPPIAFPVYPVVQHLAEKLHAYTLPRDQENTRVKDLLDMILLATVECVAADALAAALIATFQTRATHPIPNQLPEPPGSWTAAFAAMVGRTPLVSVNDLAAGYALVAAFWNPMLAGTVSGNIWTPPSRRWQGGQGGSI